MVSRSSQLGKRLVRPVYAPRRAASLGHAGSGGDPRERPVLGRRQLEAGEPLDLVRGWEREPDGQVKFADRAVTGSKASTLVGERGSFGEPAGTRSRRARIDDVHQDPGPRVCAGPAERGVHGRRARARSRRRMCRRAVSWPVDAVFQPPSRRISPSDPVPSSSSRNEEPFD